MKKLLIVGMSLILSGSWAHAGGKPKPTSRPSVVVKNVVAPTSRPVQKKTPARKVGVVGKVNVISLHKNAKAKTIPRKTPMVKLPGLSPMRRYFFRRARPVPVLVPYKGKAPVHPYNIVLLAKRLEKAPKLLMGKELLVEGIVSRGDARSLGCTLMLCSKAFPCCNRCNQPLILRDAWSKQGFPFAGTYKGRYVGCSGTECMQRCAPFVAGKRYRVVVKVEKLNIMSASKLPIYERYVLRLVSFRPF